MKKFLENRLIGTKLGLGFGSVLLLTLVVGLVGISGVNSLLSRADKVRLSSDLNLDIINMQIARGNFVVSGSEEDKNALVDMTKQLGDNLDKGKQLYEGDDVVGIVTEISQNLADYKKALVPLENARKKWNQVDTQAKGILANIHSNFDNIIDPLKSNNDQGNALQAITIEKHLFALTSMINDLVSQSKPIPMDQVETKLSTFVDQTKALQLPSNLQTYQQNIVSLLNQYSDLGKMNPTLAGDLVNTKNQLLKLSSNMDKKIDQLTLLQEQKSKQEGGMVNTTLITATIIAILLGIFFALIIRQMIVKPMNAVTLAVEKVSNGDLTQQISTDRKDELGQLYNNIGSMSKTLNTLVSEVIAGVLNLSSTSEQLEALSKQSQSMMQSQRDETDQVATAINEMSSTVAEVARNAETAADATTKTDDIVRKGNIMINDTAKHIESLASDLNVTSQTMEQLKTRTDNVGNVLEVIKAVAEQTNLLALNAAIEAARAGEAGRGFAVVADEVRGLASRTQSSAKEIEDLIVELQNGAQESFAKMLSSRDMSMENAEKAKGVLALFKEISEQVGYVQDMNQQIATAAEEQSHVADEINQSVENVRSLADKTSKGTDESVGAVSNLRRLSHQLKALTDRFKVVS